MAYANGQIPLSALQALSTGGHMLAPAAAAFETWRIQARAAGFDMRPTTVGDAYRTLERQISVFQQRYEMRAYPYVGPYNDVRYWRGVRYVRMRGAAAAVPGTSNHGKGLAIDIANAGGFGGRYHNWMSSTGPRLGFTNVEGRSVNEPWHWVHNGVWTVNNPITGGGSGSLPNPGIPGLPDPLEEDLTPEQDAALAAIWRNQARLMQVIEALDVRTGNAKGNLAVAARQVGEIHGRVNWAIRPDKSPYLIASQGDVDMILAAVRESQGGDTTVQVDANALANALVKVMGPELAAEVREALDGLTLKAQPQA